MDGKIPDILAPFPGERKDVRLARIWKSGVSRQLHEALRARILSLELAPGAALSRGELADCYGVSQTPVRDAMMKLEEEGLLVVFPQSRTLVSRIDVAQARETQFLRLSLELEITNRLARMGEPDRIAPARAILVRQRAAHAADDLSEFGDLDRALHRSLFEAVGVGNLWQLITERSGHIDRLRKLNLPDPGKAPEILDYHAQILDAVAAGHPGRAEDLVRRHLSGTLSQVDQIMSRHPKFF